MTNHADPPADPASTYFGQAQSALALEGRGRWTNEHRPHVVGTQPTVEPPAIPNWSIDPCGLEPPLPMQPGDLRSPVLGVALGGASTPCPVARACPYGVVGACLLIDQGIGPCVCGGDQ